MNTQSGRSMVEMLGVLAIVGVLSLGGIAGYTKAMRNYRTNRTIDIINQLVVDIESIYFTDTRTFKYAEVDNAHMIEYGLIENNLISEGSTLVNPFNGSLLISNNETNKTFSIKLDKIPQAACMELVTMPWSTHAGNGLYSITIDSKSYSWNGSDKLPISSDAAMTSCKGEEKTIIFEFN